MLAHLPKIVAAILVALLASRLAAEESPSPDVTEPPPYERFVVIPLRVHILASAEIAEIQCNLTDADIARILGKVNGIWHRGGIHFGLESIRRETAAGQEEFKKLCDGEGVAPLGSYPLLMPAESRALAGLHVYYVHKLPVNGVYLGADIAFVQETAQLRPVEGGIDEPIPRVTAHELAHALTLQHRQNETNLLASGTTGTLLNEAEVKAAHEAAEKTGGAPVADLRKAALEAEQQSRTEDARRLWTWLGEIPGDGGAEAVRHRDALGSSGQIKSAE